MASAGTVTVDFAAETAKFTAELKKVREQISGLEKNLQTFDKVGRLAFRFFTAGAIISFARSAIRAGDALGDAAERAGIAVESFSRLQFAAGRADVEVSSFTAGISKFQVAISKASEGNKQALSTFALLNIEISKLRGLSIQEQLGIVADAFADIKDPADRTRIAIEFFGKAAGPQFVPFLAQGSEGMRKFTEQADRLGITMTESAAKGIDRATKATEGFIASIKQGIAVRFGDLVTDIFGSGDQIIDLEFRVKNLNELLKGLQGAPVPDTESIRRVTEEIRLLNIELTSVRRTTEGNWTLLPLPWIGAVEEIDLAGIQALKINVDELALSFTRLNQSIVEIQQARASEALQLVNDAVVENQRLIEQLITADLQAELDARVAATQRANEFQLQQEAALQQTLKSLRASTFSAAIGALQSFAGHSKKAAIALVAINKAVAISQAIQNTAAAATKAIAVYGPTPAGFAAAAAAKAFGALQIAAIVASGIGEIQQINRSGGAPIGSPSNPAFVNSTNSASDQQFGATSQRATQIVFAGPVFNNRETRQAIVDAIREEVDNEVIVISPSSRNGQELLGAPA